MTAPVYDITGPLPRGRSALEASAGTGKTWTIAALVTRFVVEAGVPIDQLLVITFTRAASSELRERVRSRLVEAREALDPTMPSDTDDVLLAHLLSCDADERVARFGRASVALSRFDSATISTIHGFASGLLRFLGVLPDAPLIPELIDDAGTYAEVAVADTEVTMFTARDEPAFTPAHRSKVARAVLANPEARIVPDGPDDDGGPVAQARLEFACRVRAHVRGEIDRAGGVTYDDLLSLARDALFDERVGERARAVLREAYQVALIDEFQDTDGVQWAIAEAIFDGIHGSLTMIGDPKQAIYSFRGADIDAYLRATEDATEHATLATNWRSDGPLITALEAILTGTEFGDSRIGFESVEPAPGHRESRVEGVAYPVEIRIADTTTGANTTTAPRWLTADAAVDSAAADVTSSILQLLDGSVTIPDADGRRPLRAGDIAILCRTRIEVGIMTRHLWEANIPSVVGNTGSVLTTQAADDWLTLLWALEQPASATRVRRALVGPFVGKPPRWLATVDENEIGSWHDTFAEWAKLLTSRGVPQLLGAIEEKTNLAARLVARNGGERLLTDLHHVAELLHDATRAGGIRFLADWLHREQDLAQARPDDAERRLRRLETDADAVHVLTIHSAKGLEFPVVLLPFSYKKRSDTGATVPVLTDPNGSGRIVDVSGSGHRFDLHKQAWGKAQDGEDLRLLYVALTRARHHLRIWWPLYNAAEKSALAKVLFGQRPGVINPSTAVPQAKDADDTLARLQPLLTRSGGTIGASIYRHLPDPAVLTSPDEPSPELRALSFSRRVDETWRRWSYSMLKDDTHREIPDTVRSDEPTDEPSTAGVSLPLADAPSGTGFGTLVHHVLEGLDFDARDLPAAVGERLVELVHGDWIELISAFTDGLTAALTTPLDPVFPGLTLTDLGVATRIDEMEFHLPVAVGATIGRLADLIAANVPTDDPLAPYPGVLRSLGRDAFHGFLHGFIDLTVHVDDVSGHARWWVADYKTNTLTPRGDKPSIGDYRFERLAKAMMEAHYPLQALLYQVALHRYLGVRVPDYDPERDLGGAAYFFLRGMIGPDAPLIDDHRPGVFTWGPHPDLVVAVDRLFKGD